MACWKNLFCVTLFATVSLIFNPIGAEVAREPELTVDRIAESIQGNYDRIQDAHFKLEEVSWTPGMREWKVLIAGNVTVALDPLRTRTYEMYLCGESIRRAEIGGQSETWIRSHGPWVRHAPGSHFAFHKNLLEGTPFLDPREVGTQDARDTFVNQLRNSTILEIQKVEMEQGQVFYDVLFEKNDDPALKYRCRLDSSRNFLPVHVAYIWPDHREILTIEIGYHCVLPQTWLMAHSLTTYRLSGRVHERHVVGDVTINEGLDDKLFQVATPEGSISTILRGIGH